MKKNNRYLGLRRKRLSRSGRLKAKVMAEREVEEELFSVPDEYQAFLYGFTTAEEVPCCIMWEEATKAKIGKKKMRKGKKNKG